MRRSPTIKEIKSVEILKRKARKNGLTFYITERQEYVKNKEMIRDAASYADSMLKIAERPGANDKNLI